MNTTGPLVWQSAVNRASMWISLMVYMKSLDVEGLLTTQNTGISTNPKNNTIKLFKAFYMIKSGIFRQLPGMMKRNSSKES